jgi:hypothetical protein
MNLETARSKKAFIAPGSFGSWLLAHMIFILFEMLTLWI